MKCECGNKLVKNGFFPGKNIYICKACGQHWLIVTTPRGKFRIKLYEA